MPQAIALLKKLSESIALLVSRAERGEIDPWDVQVIDVIDRYLNQVFSKERDRLGEADLSASGQAFVYASTLVLLKADSLSPREAEEIAELVDEEGEDDLEEGAEVFSLPRRLEQYLRRRGVAPPPVKRQVTLPELLTQLQLMAKTAMEKPRVRSRRPSRAAASEDLEAIAQLAQQENLSDIADALGDFLESHWHRMVQGRDWLEIDRLQEFWCQETPQDGATSHRYDRVCIFWALLFLCAQSRVELHQEQFYQDLRIRLLAPDAVGDDRAGVKTSPEAARE